MKTLKVDLSTPRGPFLSTTALAIEIRSKNGTVRITPDERCFLNLVQPTEMTLQTDEGTSAFLLENAVAGLKGRHITVLAERIERVEESHPFPLR